MPAARYWRIARIETFAGGDLELSEVALYEGATRVDGAATVSSGVAPVSGSLTDLGDASFSTSARWAGDAVRLPGFAVVWDFGAGVTKDVTSVEVAGPGQATFAHKFALEYSSDGAAWERLYATVMGSKWPGDSAFFTLDAPNSEDRLRGFVVGHAGVNTQTKGYAFDGATASALADFNIASGYSAQCIAVSPDGAAVVFGTIGTPYLRLVTRAGRKFTGASIQDASNKVYGLCFSGDGAYLAVAQNATPYLTIYKRSGDDFVRLANPASPSGNANAVSFSADGVYLAVAHQTTPYLTIYKRSGDTFTKLPDPAILPGAGTSGYAVALSSDGVYLAVGHDSGGFLTLYNRSGDTFTKLPNPAVMPTSGGSSSELAFSPDGSHLYVSWGSGSAPRCLIYSRSGDTFTSLSLPAELTGGVNDGAAYSPDGAFLAVCVQSALSVFARSGDVYSLLEVVAEQPEGAATAVAWLPFTDTSPANLPANYDATPLRTVDQAAPSMIGEDVAGFTQAFSAAKPPQLDIYDAGRGRITGTVKERAYPADIPVKRRVALLSMPGSRAIRETWSDSVTGEYEFAEIAMDRTYTVVSYDHTGTYMGEVADNVQPTLMA